jgi:hypothetical protein
VNIYEAFETSSEAIEEGRWLEIVFQGQAVCAVRVRSASPDLNPELRKAMTNEALGLIGETKDPDLTVRRALQDPDLEVKLFAAAVLSDWRDVTDRNGKALKFTTKNAEKILRELPLLFQQVKAAAYRWETFRLAVVEEAVGNSATSSARKSAA